MPQLHLIYLRPDGMLVSKKPYGSWREIQDEFPDYMTSLGPYTLDELLEFLDLEHGPDEERRFLKSAELRRFVASKELLLSADGAQ